MICKKSNLLSNTPGPVKNSYTGAHIVPMGESQARNICCAILLRLLHSVNLKKHVWEEKQKFPAT